MKNTLKKLTSILLALAMVLALGCFALAEGEEAPEEAGEEEEDIFDLTEEELAALPRIGEETEDCAAIVLYNAAEGDITSVNIRAKGDAEWSLNMLPDKEVFEDKEMAVLCFEPEEDTLYEIQFIFSNYTGSAVHDVDFTDIANAELHRQWNGLVYLVYTSLATEEEVDTSEAEQTLAEEQIAAGSFAYGGSSDSGSDGGDSYSDDSGWSSGYSDGGSDSGCIGSAGLLY